MKRAYPFSQLWCQRDRERVAVPLPFVGSDDHTRAIEEFYIFKPEVLRFMGSQRVGHN